MNDEVGDERLTNPSLSTCGWFLLARRNNGKSKDTTPPSRNLLPPDSMRHHRIWLVDHFLKVLAEFPGSSFGLMWTALIRYDIWVGGWIIGGDEALLRRDSLTTRCVTKSPSSVPLAFVDDRQPLSKPMQSTAARFWSSAIKAQRAVPTRFHQANKKRRKKRQWIN